MTIASRIATIRQQLPDSVRLIAVTKQVPTDAIREAYDAGIRDFGESKVQETAEKQSQLQDLPGINWHLIGHLQANKAAKALEQFQWIHSLDNLKLATRLDRLAGELSCSPQVCLQVKILPDPDKYGWTIPELLADLPELNRCQHLKIQGLMTIPPLGLDDSQIREFFNTTRELADQIQQQNLPHIQMEQLSMGMSGDYHLAIQAGATMIRLGQTLFGSRRGKI
ncbi:MAG: YggS family pyridoxal phosphate-dependent enzyme [Oscillatoriales cyanobacterium]|uniref:Pyridoxal phosphate homeostasis protein n=1 Tax=Microcoleus anatoxicus PTRS2 TaxID=2705321 RepID=A0ABU8YLI6_9CYAN|nr:MAG: YggS family pyridoxal phosphate-dependent enzyme [Oscillatoriales cyanobacterium]TAD92871.1 MAG: YggS family pyridoxal phosphate-dependent enzyme [Oscillatoriales cyanobacterium]TAE03109.1 MAG: YggS family pyridoxal phosphate-dependent enzyme [Oscillatoriales cyanobacterium]TAF00568.1 MAG: YggS family pyridoxal phosphate-dependent enzyme [Oscillatoriales cyanobacterium]TAF47741.1 MAG: YggS family pyridoxal phosphate-dependent enzyme [Oscillatoriales cyanobacterium]